MTLKDEIEATEAHLAALRLKAASATCAEVGHRWKHIGGANAGCEFGHDCTCSTPVQECEVCGACDYGEQARAGVIDECRHRAGH